MIKLTELEKTILENVKCEGKDANWLVRDEDGNIICFHYKPKKNNENYLDFIYWENENKDYPSINCLLEGFNHLFNFVDFDKEPFNIKELLENV